MRRKECQLNPVRRAQLVEDVSEVRFDRVLADRGLLGNLLVGVTGDD